MSDGVPDLEPYAVAIATVRRFAEDSGAARITVLLDRGEQDPAVLECAAGLPLALSLGDDEYAIAPAATAGVDPLPVEVPRAAPGTAVEVDPETGAVTAPLGVLPALAEGLLDLARALGGRTVASGEFPTRDPSHPLTLAARDGDPVVVAVGDEQFEL